MDDKKIRFGPFEDDSNNQHIKQVQVKVNMPYGEVRKKAQDDMCDIIIDIMQERKEALLVFKTVELFDFIIGMLKHTKSDKVENFKFLDLDSKEQAKPIKSKSKVISKERSDEIERAWKDPVPASIKFLADFDFEQQTNMPLQQGTHQLTEQRLEDIRIEKKLIDPEPSKNPSIPDLYTTIQHQMRQDRENEQNLFDEN